MLIILRMALLMLPSSKIQNSLVVKCLEIYCLKQQRQFTRRNTVWYTTRLNAGASFLVFFCEFLKDTDTVNDVDNVTSYRHVEKLRNV